MSTNYTSFNGVLEVVVIDRTGNKTGEIRTMENPAWLAFHKDQPVVLINWLWEGADRPSDIEISVPISFEGKEYRGDWGWGSAVKRGYTFGLATDVVADSGLATKAEDGLRLGRWLFSNSLYGAGMGDLRVLVLPPGQLFNGMPVEDGFGYVSKSIAEATYNGRDKIQLDQARDSFHFWQRIPWTDEIQAESLPLIEKALLDGADPSNWLTHNSSGMEDKKALIALDPMMIEHPFVANALARTAKEQAIRLGTTVPTNSKTRLAVPTTCKTIALNGKVVLSRYPLESWGNIRALEVKAANKIEIDRIANLEVVQYTLCNADMMAKGCLGIVADDQMNGYDVVLCQEDVKMGKASEVLTGAYLGFTMYWDKGSSIGINARYFKVMNGDFDGDNVAVTDCEDRPALFEAVSQFPEQDSLKLPKSRNPLDKRGMMIIRSMQNLVGFATNVAATTFAMLDRSFLAKRLGYTDEDAMDRQLSFFIKCGTDGYKTEIDVEKVAKQVGIVQSNLANLMGKCAPWCQWRSDDWAFTHGIPEVNVQKGADTKDAAVKMGIPAHFDGTIAQIARITMPEIEKLLKTQIAARPLTEFRSWAMQMPDALLESCGEIQIAFNARTQMVNWSDPESVNHFKVWWETTVKDWVKTEAVNEKVAAATLWRVAHSTRSTYAGASSVFFAFPDECKEIIGQKPGKNCVKSVVLGLKETVEKWAGKANLISYEEIKGKMRLIRKALVLEDAALMRFDKAVIPVDAEAPDEGEYVVSINRRSEKSWEVRFA